MHEGYRKYLDVLAAKGMSDPMSEKEWMSAVGINDGEEHIPIMVRPKRDDRPCAATREHHIPNVGKMVNPKKLKAPKIPKAKKPQEPKIPKQSKRRKSDEEIEATKIARMEREYERRRIKRMERRIANGLPPVKTNLKAMSEEERNAHLAMLRKAQRERENAKRKSDPEYQAKKKEREKIYQRKYAKMNRGRSQRWAKNNPERIKEINRLWREKNREKLRANAKARREKKKSENPDFLIKERMKAKELRERKRNTANVSWSVENGCAA